MKFTCLLFLPLVVLLADPEPPGPKPCSPSLANPSCSITIDTSAAVSPLPIQLNKGAAVSLTVKKRGVEKILVETEWKEIDTPDPALEIVKSFLPNLAKLRFESSMNIAVVTDPEFPSVDRVIQQQKDTDTILATLIANLEAANTKLKNLSELTVAQCNNATFLTSQNEALDLVTIATKGTTSLRAMEESIKKATAEMTALMGQNSPDEAKLTRFRDAIEQIDAKRTRQAPSSKQSMRLRTLSASFKKRSPTSQPRPANTATPLSPRRKENGSALPLR